MLTQSSIHISRVLACAFLGGSLAQSSAAAANDRGHAKKPREAGTPRHMVLRQLWCMRPASVIAVRSCSRRSSAQCADWQALCRWQRRDTACSSPRPQHGVKRRGCVALCRWARRKSCERRQTGAPPIHADPMRSWQCMIWLHPSTMLGTGDPDPFTVCLLLRALYLHTSFPSKPAA